MMSNVVREGTGTAAALEGIEVAGKTGTAELNIAQGLNQPWFIGFAPRTNPKVAIAVTLENIVGGSGRRRRGADRQAGHAGAAAMRQIDDDAIIDSRYRITAHLGSGGMAEVYCAKDLQLGRNVALKVLHERFAEDEQFVERFKREASSAAGLAHQHVVAIYDRGEWDGTSYIAMEYVAGRTLKQIIVEEGPLPPQRAVDLTVQILRAARFAHRRGIVHRDFKPQNVIVDDEDRAKVTDFGIARAGASDMTQTGSILGTAQYLSPEQAQGHAVGARSDLYSIGIVLYELLTGRVPFDADSAVTIALKQVNEAPVPPSELNPRVTPELESVVLRALAKDPADRFADADEFVAALDAAASRIPSPRAIAAAEAAAAALPAAAAMGGGVMAPPPPPAPPPSTGVHRLRPAPRGAQGAAARVACAAALGAARRRPQALALAAGRPADRVRPAVRPRRRADAGARPGAERRRRLDLGRHAAAEERRLQWCSPCATTPTSRATRSSGRTPAPARWLPKGSEVTITVSDGPAITNVPEVVGDGRLVARKKLTDAGFKIRETRIASDGVADQPRHRPDAVGRLARRIGQRRGDRDLEPGPSACPFPTSSARPRTRRAARSSRSASSCRRRRTTRPSRAPCSRSLRAGATCRRARPCA